MSRWVAGSVIGALLAAPIGFAGFTPVPLAAIGKLAFILLLAAAVVFSGLAAVWNRRWAV